MSEANRIRETFRYRFLAAAERHLGMSRYHRGFPVEVARSLKVRQVSVIQRWLAGSGLPGLPHLLTIYREWGVSPGYLMGIEEELARKKK